ncbi:MAG: hypothetical protein DHS20C10_10760 [marine bacterium B5-7]|nr:MAG: hypothetical protein DHS20C10_10760 [marine bacterium B5-7]
MQDTEENRKKRRWDFILAKVTSFIFAGLALTATFTVPPLALPLSFLSLIGLYPALATVKDVFVNAFRGKAPTKDQAKELLWSVPLLLFGAGLITGLVTGVSALVQLFESLGTKIMHALFSGKEALQPAINAASDAITVRAEARRESAPVAPAPASRATYSRFPAVAAAARMAATAPPAYSDKPVKLPSYEEAVSQPPAYADVVKSKPQRSAPLVAIMENLEAQLARKPAHQVRQPISAAYLATSLGMFANKRQEAQLGAPRMRPTPNPYNAMSLRFRPPGLA